MFHIAYVLFNCHVFDLWEHEQMHADNLNFFFVLIYSIVGPHE